MHGVKERLTTQWDEQQHRSLWSLAFPRLQCATCSWVPRRTENARGCLCKPCSPFSDAQQVLTAHGQHMAGMSPGQLRISGRHIPSCILLCILKDKWLETLLTSFTRSPTKEVFWTL